jgi:2'-hydroxyisoflavone reductase
MLAMVVLVNDTPAMRDDRCMRLLVLGGTRYVGRVLVDEAVRRGHQVTIFNRGRTGVDPNGVEVVRGDRENAADLQRLVVDREWDVVVDSSGYVPAVVGDAARALSGRCRQYVFLSTVSVYPAWPDNAVSEDSTVHECEPDVGGTAEDEANWTAQQYGAYKAGCERAAEERFDGPVTVLRPGVILGPQENVGRLTWWLGRIARGGTVLAPGRPDRQIQPIDVRDVAAFALECAEETTAGIFNVAAPLGQATFGAMLADCATATGEDAQLVWVADDFLVDHKVRQWTEIPLWRTHPGTWQMDTSRAQAGGLACRSLTDTVNDTWAWLSEGEGPTAYKRQAHHGLEPEREQELLQLWRLTGRSEAIE